MAAPFPSAERAPVSLTDPAPRRATSPEGTPGWVAGVSVRAARPGDVRSIAAIEQAAFSDPWSARSFLAALRRPEVHMTVAEARSASGESAVAGYLVAWFVAGEGEIANIAVHADWRRQGVGAALLDDVLAAGRAADVGAMYLEVRDSNVAAQALYTSRGFQPVGRRRRYYVEPVEDALVLRWESGVAPPRPPGA